MSYLELALHGMKCTGSRQSFVPTKPSSRDLLAAALTRLRVGETRVLRCYSHTCKGQFLILRDGEIPDSITIDCPTFTLSELESLIGSSRENIKAVYHMKQVFGGAAELSDSQ